MAPRTLNLIVEGVWNEHWEVMVTVDGVWEKGASGRWEVCASYWSFIVMGDQLTWYRWKERADSWTR